MDKTDLEKYQGQLSQVESALQANPGNTELIELRQELVQLISLAEEANKQSEALAASSSAGPAGGIANGNGRPGVARRYGSGAGSGMTWTVGSDCLARFSGDGSWYPARIVSMGGSAENPVYSVVFRGYNTTELVKNGELRVLPAEGNAGPAKRKLSKEEEKELERRKKRNNRKRDVQAAKATEQMLKQTRWQKFTKKAEKKGVQIAGVSGTSIFKTPDNPLGKGERL